MNKFWDKYLFVPKYVSSSQKSVQNRMIKKLCFSKTKISLLINEQAMHKTILFLKVFLWVLKDFKITLEKGWADKKLKCVSTLWECRLRS